MVVTGNKGPFLTVSGILAGQTPQVVNVFKKALPFFECIIEIGGGRGGFSTFLNANKKGGARFISYEINRSRLLLAEDSPLDMRIGDCFHPATFNEIKGIISQPLKTLLLCDGGNKPKEFISFAPSLKRGDVIMCHDYCHDPKDWKDITQKIAWPTGPEVYRKDISSPILDNGLAPFKYDSFKSVLWGSFVKE